LCVGHLVLWYRRRNLNPDGRSHLCVRTKRPDDEHLRTQRDLSRIVSEALESYLDRIEKKARK